MTSSALKGSFILRVWLLAILALSVADCSRKQNAVKLTPVTLNIAVSKTPLSAPFFIAEEKGFFAEQGITANLLMTSSGHLCLNMLEHKEANMGTASDYPIMMHSFQRNDFAIVATFVSSGNDVKLIARKDRITQVSDLKGKKIGTVTGASSHFFLDRFLLFNELSLADVNVVPIKPEDMPKALADGRVDALSVWEPNGFLTHKLMGQEALIFPSKNYYRETFNLVFTKEYIHKHPQLIVRTLKALHHAIQFIHQQPKQAQQILTRKLQLDNDFISWVWQDLNFQLSLDQSLIKTLETESEWAIKNNIVKKSREIDYTRYLYLDALTKVDSSMVTVIH